MKRSLGIAAFLAVLVTLPATTSKLVALERGMFGWRGGEVSGNRPLLVIWVREQDDVPPSELNKYRQYYQDVIFGHSAGREPPSVARNRFELSIPGYWREVSGEKFAWTRAGLIGPLTAPIKGKTVGEIAALALQAAAREGFAFRAFDVNRDGRIAPEELAVLVIANVTAIGRRWDDLSAVNRNVAIPDQGVAFAGRIAVVGENDGFATVNRELFHLVVPEAANLDGWPQKCFALNGGRLLMAAVNTANHPLTMHLDPWHKMLAGWIEPRVYAVSKANSATLAAQHVSSQSDTE